MVDKRFIDLPVNTTELGTDIFALSKDGTGSYQESRPQLAKSMGSFIPASNFRYVNPVTGSDVSGTGTFSNPWQTEAHAYSQITDASFSKFYKLIILDANSEAVLRFKPFIFVEFNSFIRTFGSIVFDNDFGNQFGVVVASNLLANPTANINGDFTTVSPASMGASINFTGLGFINNTSYNFNFTGTGNQIVAFDLSIEISTTTNMTFTNMSGVTLDSPLLTGDINIVNNLTSSITVIMNGGFQIGNRSLQTTSTGDIQFNAANANFQGSLILNGTLAFYSYTADAYPPAGLTLLGGATISQLSKLDEALVCLPGTNGQIPHFDNTNSTGMLASYTLLDSSLVSAFDWNQRQGFDSSSVISIHTGSRLLYDASSNFSADWNNRLLYDSSEGTSLRWNERHLIASDSTTVSIDWSNPFFINTARAPSQRTLTPGTGYQPSTTNDTNIALTVSMTNVGAVSSSASFQISPDNATWQTWTTIQTEVAIINNRGMQLTGYVPASWYYRVNTNPGAGSTVSLSAANEIRM